MKFPWLTSLLAFSTKKSTPKLAELSVRPFEAAKDQDQLQYICRNVYGGTDYLPDQASELEQDLYCSFQALTGKQPLDDEKEETILLAVANLRALNDKTGWLEAVRVNEDYRGQGLATRLLQDLVTRVGAREKEYERILSVTIESNLVMQRVFQRLGMKQASKIKMTQFVEIVKLPGYASGGTEEPCQHLLDALDITHLVPAEAKNFNLWQPVTDAASLEQHLEHTSSTGLMPGVWKLMGPKTPLLMESMREGLVFALKGPSGDSIDAVMALVRDKPLSSLKSPWVLCVAGSEELQLYSALFCACFSHDIQKKLKEDVCVDGDAGFGVVFDGRIALQPSLAAKLPLRDDEAIVYSVDCKKE